MPLDTSKEVFTAKCDGGYFGCLRTEDCIAITKKSFPKPLQAANAARKLKKTLGLIDETPTDSLPGPRKAKSLPLRTELYTAEQMHEAPLLKFREVWLITKDEDYVQDCLNKETKKILSLTRDRGKAKHFDDHVAATRAIRVLKGVVGPGFGLVRYFAKAA